MVRGPSRKPASRLRPALELLTGVALFEADVWWLRSLGTPLWHYASLMGIAAIMAVSHQRRPSSVGAPAPASWRGWGEALAVTAALGCVLVAAGELLRLPYEADAPDWTATFGAEPLQNGLRRGGIATGQQLVLHLFLWPVCFDLLRRRAAAIVVAGLIFGLAHLPSVTLGISTAFAAAVWSALYLRSRIILPLIVSHILLSGILQAALPQRLHYGMAIGTAAREEQARARILTSADGAALLAQLAAQDYYEEAGGTDSAWLALVFQKLLSRAPTPLEMTIWTERLQNQSRYQVVADLLIAGRTGSRR